MAKKQSNIETTGVGILPTDTSALNTDTASVTAPEGNAPALPNPANAESSSANTEVCPPGVRKLSLSEARALHAAKHLTGV